MKNKNYPDEWLKVTLGDIVYLKNGFAFKSTDYVSPSENTAPIIRISDIVDGTISDSNSVHVQKKSSYSSFQLVKGDLLIAMSGATTGKTGIYNYPKSSYQNQRVGNLKLWLNSKPLAAFRNHLVSSLRETILSIAYGGAQPNISAKDIEKIEFYLPPLAEQQEITKKLDTMLGTIKMIESKLSSCATVLTQAKQSLLTTASNGKLTSDWRKQHNINSGKVSALKDVGTIIAGQSPSVAEVNTDEEGIVYITGPEQWDGTQILKHKWTNAPKKIAPENSIFITVKGAGVGKTFPGCHAAIGRDIQAFVPDPHVIPEYALYAIQASTNEIILDAKGLIPGLTKKMVAEHTIYLPSKLEQKEIVKQVSSILSQLSSVEQKLMLTQKTLSSLTTSILTKAFSGELTADWRKENQHLINGENSASALLEQIKQQKTAMKTAKTRRTKKK